MSAKTEEQALPYYQKNNMTEIEVDDKSTVKYRARCCVAEFVGCLIFVFVGSCSFFGGNKYGLEVPAMAHGFTIALLIIGLGHLSGGHFNPAVTVGIAISREINPILAVCYIVSQLLGGFFGALLVRGVMDYPVYMYISGGTTNANLAYTTIWGAMGAEVVMTYILVHTVLNAAVDSDGSNVLAALGIGLCVLVDIMAGGMISGASMNPARSFGPAVVYSFFYEKDYRNQICGNPCGTDYSKVWEMHWIHWVGPMLGAVIAGLMYTLVFARRQKRLIKY